MSSFNSALCITGIALGLLLFNAPMGVMAEVGSFALIGTVIRNSMVIIQQIDLHEEAGMTRHEAVVEGALVRFRPIMLAALTTILGLVPMFASPFWNAMAIAMACSYYGAARPSPCSFCRRSTAQSIGLNPLEAKIAPI